MKQWAKMKRRWLTVLFPEGPNFTRQKVLFELLNVGLERCAYRTSACLFLSRLRLVKKLPDRLDARSRPAQFVVYDPTPSHILRSTRTGSSTSAPRLESARENAAVGAFRLSQLKYDRAAHKSESRFARPSVSSTFLLSSLSLLSLLSQESCFSRRSQCLRAYTFSINSVILRDFIEFIKRQVKWEIRTLRTYYTRLMNFHVGLL